MAETADPAWAERKCTPCEGKVAPFTAEVAARHLKTLPGWSLSDDAQCILNLYTMKHFVAAVDLVRRIAEVAEAENHHPDLHLTGYRKLAVELSTHAIGGLSENDFIVAAKIDALPKELKKT